MAAQLVSKPDPAAPLWRAAQGFRLLSCLYALGFQLAVNRDLAHPVAAWALFGLLMAWSLACAAAYLLGFGRRAGWVLAEVLVAVLLVLSTDLVASPAWIAGNQSWPTTLWATNATLSAAIQLGPVAGMGAGLAVTLAGAVLKGYFDVNLGRQATLVIELAVGLAVGMAAQTARRAHADLQRAARLAAATAERERLSRQVHDGAIQVLALVARRGREIGGETTELAQLAGEQERALRSLVSSGLNEAADGFIDVGGMLRAHAGERVAVSVPPGPVLLDAAVAGELDAAVVNVLGNTAAHAGPEARAFVLVEDLGEQVVISIRDDGVGIADGRLAQAAAEGHMGVTKSIVGRLESLGGSAELTTAPGAGTEWELTVSRAAGPDA
ncbi:sensor histidine kinase [Mycobacterium sp. CBMA 213]|nr:sensor histidine kinase [Mycolicibacterium sp. CBMA 213]